MFRKVLVANRGAIATRILRTLRRMGVGSVAVYSEADATAPHVLAADEAVCIGPPKPAESYLRGEKILEVARATGAEALHPGYGFLAENADFAEACEAAGVAFIGPTPEQMRAFGLKHTARALAAANGVPLLPGTDILSGVEDALAAAERIGYPVMLKSTAGGGGIGMRRCNDAAELASGYDAVDRLARANFKQAGLYLEKLVTRARHVEVQIFGDGAGTVLALGERDCSLQRRNQKVVEETPAPGISAATRAALLETAARLGRGARYRSAGTVEFILDASSPALDAFYFLEVNTRIQVEHGVTEEVTGIDLVEWMVRLAAGALPDLATRAPTPRGASIQARLYAEDPKRGFQPSCGVLTDVWFPASADVRVESAVERGSEVTPFYDPMLAKIIARGETREVARRALVAALEGTRVAGIESNRDYLIQVLRDDDFADGDVDTSKLASFDYAPRTIEVLEGGTQTTVQDFPGRLGHWDVGVPPSGPMDALSFRLANRLVGNGPDAAGLECALVGPALRFHAPAVVALTGADMRATVDGKPAPRFEALAVGAGSELRLAGVRGHGSRGYLAIRGGLDVPSVLGSRATFTLGLFGGHGGRALAAGDVLHLGGQAPVADAATARLPFALMPSLADAWDIAVLQGPHGAPDFFQPADIDDLFATAWRVHYNSSRTGVRLIGPKPRWARADGGEAGLHPSNIHDNAYAIGTIDFTGDMPVILGPDGPSLGGFVCPATIIEADLWKVGQLKPGDTVRFRAVTLEDARARRAAQEDAVETLRAPPTPPAGLRTLAAAADAPDSSTAILVARPARGERPAFTIRQDGDANVLCELGPATLDFALRFRAHALMQAVSALALPGIIDLTPGIRSLQIHYDDRRLPRERLLDALVEAEAELPDTDDLEVPSRVVHLPLSWDDPATQLAIRKYTQSVRPDAPWCPSNIEFIRRINGLASIDEVKEIVFGATYLVLGLGDVYLGAPVATPLDPRHRLVTTKYNPARTWTPENAVGIGGAYLCVYGMEGPGGYQFVGRTCQMWNRFHETPEFTPGHPWLLRFFDQIRFYPVSERELLDFRVAFPRGRARVKIEPTTFKFADYRKFLDDNAETIDAFRGKQRAAFVEERERWKLLPPIPDEPAAMPTSDAEKEWPEGFTKVASPVTGSVWEIKVAEGATVAAGDTLVVMETMKMETPVVARAAGKIAAVTQKPGALVTAGQTLVVVEPA
ncbi:MAG TPA: urea carboxylase [Polyangia bacterium]|nr:urea carboxylase [Polyangia bacterium]